VVTDLTDQETVLLRVRMGAADAHYGGDLVDGARMLRLFGDAVTEIAIRTDGDEGLLSHYSEVTFTAPVHAGDFIEVTGRLTKRSRLRRVVELEARKVIAARYDRHPTAAEVLDEPVVVCRATGVVVVPVHTARRQARTPVMTV
jgi:3-aminobutyryl-CoA ammonia-lyase